MEIFSGLNEKQIEAVKTIEGPVLILAGAGSGKTKTLTHRVAYLISQGIKPENILAVTFTNKAAGEMQSRVWRLIPNSPPTGDLPKGEKLFIGTFHSFGAKILREEIDKLNYSKNFVIYDEDDSFGLAKNIISEIGLSRDRFKPGPMLNLVSKIKSELWQSVEIDADDYYKRGFASFYHSYQKRLKAINAVDFDDLIMLPVLIFSAKGVRPRPIRLWRRSASGGEKPNNILEKYQNQYQYILVDEYQDTNEAQYRLINLLAQKSKNLFVIGDPDQAIYGWRFADFRNILNFEKDYPEAKIVKLEQNYRSTQNILNASHEIISKNVERKEKKLWTENPSGTLIELIENSDEKREAEFIISKVIEFNKSSNIDLNKIVVMYRTNAQSRVLEEACLYNNLPYRVVGAIKFYQRKEIKDVLAFLRLIQNPSDEISLKRILGVLGKAGFTKFSGEFEKLKESAKLIPPSEIIKILVKKIRYYDYLSEKFPGIGPDGELESESRMRNVRELIGLAGKFDPNNLSSNNLSRFNLDRDLLQEFLIEATLMQEERNEKKGDKLNLMTLHSAKGLEFDAVFIAGCEEGLMPHSRSQYSFEELEEERRLCYVGMTRAKKHLWISFVKSRGLWGERNETLPSRFVMELPPHLVKFTSFADGYNMDNLPEVELD